jgi:hypothetical protein
MKMHTVLLLTFVAVLALPLTACAQSTPKAHSASPVKSTQAKAVAVPMYECPICHHKANAALAKKLHYVCPMDNGKLALVKTASLQKPH